MTKVDPSRTNGSPQGSPLDVRLKLSPPILSAAVFPPGLKGALVCESYVKVVGSGEKLHDLAMISE